MQSEILSTIKSIPSFSWGICVLYILFFSQNILAQGPQKIRVKDAPPPGFEDLVRPQTTEVDVYYGNEKVGSTLATYTPDSIELISPEEVTAIIPHLIDPDIITKSLSGPINTHASEVCLSELQRECGIIEPNIAGVIFDESRFRLYVFVNSLQLQPQGIVSNKFLPKITSPKFSSVNAFSNSFSGEDGDSSYTSGANHIISYGQSRLQTLWDYSDTLGFSVETLSLQNDNEGIAKELGFFNSNTRFTSFTNNLDIAGTRIYSSTNTRTDLDYSQATEIFLFLNSRSQIEVFKDNKLIDGGFYDAGNQQLDTLRLPSGSYPITLRITDSAGNTRGEQFFFVKTAILPPQDQPLHFLEMGLLEKDNSEDSLPEISDSELIRVGTAYRLQNNLGGSIEYLHSADIDLMQGSLSYFGPGYLLQNSIMYGTDSEWGLQFLGHYRRENFAINFDYRQVDSAQDDFEEDIEARILPDDFSQGSISASIPFRKGQLTLRTQYNDKRDEDSRTSYGLDYRYPLLQRNRYSIEANFSSAFEEDDYRIQSGLRITRTKPGQFLTIHPSYLAREINGDSEQGPLLFAGLTNSYENTRYGRFTYGGFLSEELERSTAGVRAENSSSYGRADVQFEWIDDEDRGDFTRFRGVQNANVLSDGKQLTFGGDRNTSSGIVLNLQGPSIDEPFEIFVNGQPRGFTKVGKRTVLPLDAFNTYSIRIRSRSNELLHFEEGPRKITLYPGNVQTITYDVQPVIVLITRILLADGSPAAHVRIENAIGYAVTDEDGWLQAELSGNTSLQISKNGKEICSIKLPKLEINQGVAFVDNLSCSE